MRAIISRLLAGPIAAFVAWLIGLGIEVTSDEQTALTEAATLLVFAIITSLYGVVHKLLDKKINPADTAKPIHGLKPHQVKE